MPVAVLIAASTCRSGNGSSRALTSWPSSVPSAVQIGRLGQCARGGFELGGGGWRGGAAGDVRLVEPRSRRPSRRGADRR